VVDALVSFLLRMALGDLRLEYQRIIALHKLGFTLLTEDLSMADIVQILNRLA
jgi:hypothetical protein